jgi:hypothetical protein
MRPYILSTFWLGIFLILFQACQPGNLTRKNDQVPVDSSLYFQQVEVKDAFMDTVFSPGVQAATLSMKVVPPPPAEPEPPRFKEIEGFRVQVFAGLDSLNAILSARQCRNTTNDSIYLFKEKQLYKIQIGDYPYRYQADSSKMSWRKNGFPGAWVVKRPVLIPIADEEIKTPTAPVISTASSNHENQERPAGKYKIQVMATATMERAQLLVNDLVTRNKFPAFTEKSGTIYKVMVGPFSSEAQARQVLESLRKSGYPDAWLVY